jgi:hypothetical protein
VDGDARDHARYPWKEEPNPYFELRTSEIRVPARSRRARSRRGTRIIEYLGQRISWRTADKRYDDEKMNRHHTSCSPSMTKTCIDAAVNGNDARFINHSCDPNCEAINDRKRIFIEAIKTIPAGTELVYDYQYERTDDHSAEDERFYKCRCGSPKCRGTILAPHRPTADVSPPAATLRALMRRLVDYAGLFPPAALSMEGPSAATRRTWRLASVDARALRSFRSRRLGSSPSGGAAHDRRWRLRGD